MLFPFCPKIPSSHKTESLLLGSHRFENPNPNGIAKRFFDPTNEMVVIYCVHKLGCHGLLRTRWDWENRSNPCPDHGEQGKDLPMLPALPRSFPSGSARPRRFPKLKVRMLNERTNSPTNRRVVFELPVTLNCVGTEASLRNSLSLRHMTGSAYQEPQSQNHPDLSVHQRPSPSRPLRNPNRKLRPSIFGPFSGFSCQFARWPQGYGTRLSESPRHNPFSQTSDSVRAQKSQERVARTTPKLETELAAHSTTNSEKNTGSLPKERSNDTGKTFKQRSKSSHSCFFTPDPTTKRLRPRTAPGVNSSHRPDRKAAC